MKKHLNFFVVLYAIVACSLFSCKDKRHEVNYEFDRIWMGEDFWTIPVEDWRVSAERIECISTYQQASMSLLSYVMEEARGDFRIAVDMGLLAEGINDGAAGGDLLIADFEADTYGEWKVEGTAFGTAPARANVAPPGNKVVGHREHGLVNSYHGGNQATGKLTSPEFTIERKYINFLIGGGNHEGKTCMDLLIDGNVVRTAVGWARKDITMLLGWAQDSGRTVLGWKSWDVEAWIGKTATLRIVDDHTGEWGHILVDHIVQSDTPPPPAPVEVTRSLRINAKFLQLPLVQHDNIRQLERFIIEDQDGEALRYMHLGFPEPGQEPEFWYSVDLREFMGQDVVLRFRSTDPDVLKRLSVSNEEIIDPQAYAGPNRPRFHFSPRMGWMNDINGTYYQDGLYHLFYQYNPTSTAERSGGFDMHWGHSVSTNLIHWEERPVALFPNKDGQAWSGTALLIDQTIAGINDNAPQPTPALFFTATGLPFTQHMATTSDGGLTWQRFSGNPVVSFSSDRNRDPKVFWHESSGHYIMLLFETNPAGFSVRRSIDLTDWERVSFIPGWFECPEFLPFKSPTTGEEIWLLYGNYNGPQPFGGGNFRAPSAYQLGTFDGIAFTQVTDVRAANNGPNFYGAITFVNEPENRHVMMGWANGPSFPGEPFNQCASVPLNLTLKDLGGEDTLCMEPVDELEALRGEPLLSLRNVSIAAANRALTTLSSEALLDVVLLVRPASNATIGVTFRQDRFDFDASRRVLSHTQASTLKSSKELHPGDSLPIRFLIDRGIIESFWNGGQASYCILSPYRDGGSALVLDGDAVVEKLTVWPMADIWE